MTNDSRPLIPYIVAILIGAGMITVYSVTSGHAAGGRENYVQLIKHILWVLIGTAALIAAAKFDYRRLRNIYGLPIIVALVLLVLVLFVGARINNAKRWIRFGHYFGFQPSEIAKLAIVIYIAGFASRHQARLKQFIRGFVPPMAVVCLTSLLIVVEPDLGTAMLVGAVGLGLLLIAGVRLRHGLLPLLAAPPAVAYLIWVTPWRLKRILAFLDPWSDPTGSGYHIIQSLIALGSGGLWGRGLGQSHQKLHFLPESSTDFVFSILGEEMGFLGASVIIILFVLLLREGIKIAIRTRDTFGSLLAAGISVTIAMQAAINIAVVTASVPTKGIALPFVSFGGSSLVISMAAVGMLLSVDRAARESEQPATLPAYASSATRPAMAFGKGGISNG